LVLFKCVTEYEVADGKNFYVLIAPINNLQLLKDKYIIQYAQIKN